MHVYRQIHLLAAFTGLANQSYWAGEDIEDGGKKEGKKAWKEREEGEQNREKREKKKEKREKKGKLKEGNHWACDQTGPDPATVTTVRLEAHFSDYGALRSTLQWIRCAAHYSDYGAIGSSLKVTINMFDSTFWVKSPGKIIPPGDAPPLIHGIHIDKCKIKSWPKCQYNTKLLYNILIKCSIL